MHGQDTERSAVSTVAIVSTSIHPRAIPYNDWAKQGDLIIAGDLNSPRELEGYVHELGGRYLTPEDQEHWSFSKHIGWNCVQRRNAAVMQAYADGYDYVVTVDDDNFPTDTWVTDHVQHIEGNYDDQADITTVEGEENWVNTGVFTVPKIHQRGTPYGVVGHVRLFPNRVPPPVVVSTAQVLGSPDCDAITRITSDPQVTAVTHDIVVGTLDWAAFNSQATVWRGDWAPFIACLPHVGRYDDIFAAFIAKRVMMRHGVSLYCGAPVVWQDRNYHDFVEDLRNELQGMHLTPHLVHALAKLVLDGDKHFANYAIIANYLAPMLPNETTQFMLEWSNEWQRNRRGRL